MSARANREEGKGYELDDSDDDEAILRRLKASKTKYHLSVDKESSYMTVMEKYGKTDYKLMNNLFLASKPETAAFAKCFVVDNDKSGFLSDNSSDDGGGGGKESKDESKTIRSVLAKHGSFTFANTSHHRNICAETVTKSFYFIIYLGFKESIVSELFSTNSELVSINTTKTSKRKIIVSNASTKSRMIIQKEEPQLRLVSDVKSRLN